MTLVNVFFSVELKVYENKEKKDMIMLSTDTNFYLIERETKEVIELIKVKDIESLVVSTTIPVGCAFKLLSGDPLTGYEYKILENPKLPELI